MSGPLVSVVTPCLNPGPRLRRCIESIRAQTYDRIEHIIVDGGSTDGSVELLSSLEGVSWISESDSGQADAINKGFAMATGSILGWLNADDVLTSSAVSTIVAAFQRDRSVTWSVGNVVVVADGRGELEFPAKVSRPQTWSTRNVAVQPGSFVTRSAIEKIGPLDLSFDYMMDLDLWLRLIDAGLQHVHVEEVVAVFEVHERSKSGSVSHAAFLIDDCRARLKSGRQRQASFGLGRAGAWEFFGKLGSAEDVLAWGLESARCSAASIDLELFAAGYEIETSVLAVKARPSRFPMLFNPRYLRVAEGRARLTHLLYRIASRPIRRRIGQRYVSMVQV